MNQVSWMNNFFIHFVERLPISLSHIVCLIILVVARKAVNPQATRIVMAARLGKVLSAVCSAVSSRPDGHVSPKHAEDMFTQQVLHMANDGGFAVRASHSGVRC